MNDNYQNINLFGASGHAKVIMDIIEAQGNKVGCLYDDAPKQDRLHDIVVRHSSKIDTERPLIISVGLNWHRKAIAERLNVRYARAIHPTAIVSPYAEIGDGSVVMQGAIIQSDAVIGQHCIVNTGASVGHECNIGNFVHIAPHSTLCGNVQVGEGTWIGAGTVVIPGVTIGKWSIVGAGSVVVRDIPDGVIAFGNPAVIRKDNNKCIGQPSNTTRSGTAAKRGVIK